MSDLFPPERASEVLVVGEPATCPASSGATWIREAWQLFKQCWLEFLVAFVLIFAARFLLGWVPIAGEIVGALLMPVLSAGFLYMAHQAKSGNEASVNLLLAGFMAEQREKLVRLLQLGLLSVAFSLVMAVLIGTVFFQQAGGLAMLEDPQLLAKSVNSLLANPGMDLLVWTCGLLVLGTLYGCAVYFAVPLLWFADVGLMQALQMSLMACKRNIGSLFVFFLVVMLLMLLAIFTFGVGFLVLFPVLMLANYTSFRDIFTRETNRPSNLV